MEVLLKNGKMSIPHFGAGKKFKKWILSICVTLQFFFQQTFDTAAKIQWLPHAPRKNDLTYFAIMFNPILPY